MYPIDRKHLLIEGFRHEIDIGHMLSPPESTIKLDDPSMNELASE